MTEIGQQWTQLFARELAMLNQAPSLSLHLVSWGCSIISIKTRLILMSFMQKDTVRVTLGRCEPPLLVPSSEATQR
jgi:hypothetical protein